MNINNHLSNLMKNINKNMILSERIKDVFKDVKFTSLITNLYHQTQILHSNNTKEKIVLSQEIGASRENDLISSLQWYYGNENVKFSESLHKADMIFFGEYISIKHISSKKLNWNSIKYDWNSNPNSSHRSMQEFIEGGKIHHMLIIVHDFRKHLNIDVYFINKDSFLENLSKHTDIFKMYSKSNARGYTFTNKFTSTLNIEQLSSIDVDEKFLITKENIDTLKQKIFCEKIDKYI